MADIAAGDVAYAEVSGSAAAMAGAGSTGRQRLFNLTFGDGALTTPAAGIPLVRASLACPTVVERLRVLGNTANENSWGWNGSQTSPTLVPQGTSADTTPDAETVLVEVEGY